MKEKIKENKNKEKVPLARPAKKNRSFLGKDLINEFDSDEIIKVKKQWNNFIDVFWTSFLIKIISKGSGAVENENIAVLLFTSQFLAIIGMVILMRYYSYKFSGKKS